MFKRILTLIVAGLLAANFAAATVILSGTYTWTGSELGESNRLFRNGTASTFSAPKAYPGSSSTSGGGYTIVGVLGFAAEAWLDIDITTTTVCCQSFVAAYLDSFDPLALATNYLGDGGSSPAPATPERFQVIVPAGRSLVLVGQTVSSLANAQGTNFSFVVDQVPEPATISLAAGGLLLLLLAARRRKA
jgi:hypothetical protein